MKKFNSVYKFLLIISICLVFQTGKSQQKNDYLIQTIAFYNVENLFDTVDNPETFDDDRTERGKDVWNSEKYTRKIENISRVLSEIGKERTREAPAIIGLCEIENRAVLEDLVNHPHLKTYNYAT